MRTALVAAVVALLLAPAGIGWAGQRAALGPQHDVPGSADVRAIAAAAPGPDQLVVLGYHDISPDPRSPQTVTPAEFADQLAMLRAAGYHSARAADLLGGARPAGRRVAITFDDGARGQWTYADAALKRYGFTAIAFVVTGSVGTYPPYYLTWPHLRAMQASGRWEFESRTDDLFRPVQIGPGRETGSPLFNRRWLPGPGRLEAMPEYEVRIRADLDRSRQVLTGHGFGDPRLISVPDPGTAPNDERVESALATVLRGRFGAVLRDDPAARAVALQAGVISRIGVRRGTSADALYTRITGRPAPAHLPSAPPIHAAAPPSWAARAQAALAERIGPTGETGSALAHALAGRLR
ncbi:MAG: hypothetical protein QOJ50_707 [Cryptosporangiaceae bacterium]|nr:hypothetical protein [Cryptosporangiaceae bacterium]